MNIIYLLLTLFLNLSQAQKQSVITPVEYFTGTVSEYNHLKKLKKQEILLNRQDVISYVSPKDDEQNLQDLLDQYKEQGVLLKSKNNTKHFAGHQEGSFGKIIKLKTGDKVDVADELGLISNYTVVKVEDFKLVNLGRGGIPKDKKDTQRLIDLLNSEDSLILQTCTYVTENGYDVRFVLAKKDEV